MKVLKVTNSPKNPDGRCTEQKRAPMMPCLKSQCDVFDIPSKPSRSTNNKVICNPCQNDLPVVTANLYPWTNSLCRYQTIITKIPAQIKQSRMKLPTPLACDRC